MVYMDRKPITTQRTSNGCLECTSHGLAGSGYPAVGWKGSPHRLARVVFENTYGPIPAGMYVLHICDNRLCLNPEHLFLGTHGDNMRDMIAKSRQRGAVGKDNSHAKLTEKEVAKIIKDSRPSREVATKYGVNKSTVLRIRSGKYWPHLKLVERSARC